jgi:hypothetical protein
MESPPDKRCEQRQPCEAAIEWAYFNKPPAHPARLLNFSKGGGYFESDQPPVAGATIQIRLQHCDSCTDGSVHRTWIRTTALGEVKWCRRLPETQSTRFGIGIRYHIPV